MRFSGSLFLIAFGATLIVSGFAYDLTFAGLPYPDPTAEMQERWIFHKRVSDRIIFTGVAFLVLAVYGKPLNGRLTYRKSNTSINVRRNTDGSIVPLSGHSSIRQRTTDSRPHYLRD